MKGYGILNLICSNSLQRRGLPLEPRFFFFNKNCDVISQVDPLQQPLDAAS